MQSQQDKEYMMNINENRDTASEAAGSEIADPNATNVMGAGYPMSEDLVAALDALNSDDVAVVGDEDDDEGDEAAATSRGDEGLLDNLIEERFASFNKLSRNRFGTGKDLMITASRNLPRDQRKVEVEVPADAIKWATDGARPTQLMILGRDPKGKHRYILADITDQLEVLNGARSRFTLNLWDEYGDPDKATATIGSAKNPVDLPGSAIQVVNWTH